MAFSYPIKPNSGDSHQMSPYWLVGFVRFFYRDTYNRDPKKPGSLDTLKAFPSAAVQEISNLLIVDNDCVSVSTSSSKESHVSNCTLSLVYTDIDYAEALAPEDWMFVWMFDNEADYQRVRGQLQSKQRCNAFNDGLKFMGRVQSVFRTLSRSPQKGLYQVAFDVQGVGFGEFDTTIFYNEAIARRYSSVLAWMSDFGTAANEFIVNGSIDANDAIPKLMRICLGLGPGEATSTLTGTDLQASPNQTFMIPSTVAALVLGVEKDQQKPVGNTYADLVKQFIGVQRYTGGNKPFLFNGDNSQSSDSADAALWKGFVPDYYSDSQRVYPSPQKLVGDFLPLPLQFNKVSVWTLLKTYVNEPVNEIYTCLRVDETGHVIPTLVTRQIPFSSGQYVSSGAVGTSFLDLPRWNIDMGMVQQLSVGRSNAIRYNYCQVIGITPFEGATANNQQLNAVNNPPIVDDADIRRAGLRMFTATVGATVIETDSKIGESPGSTWTKLMADMLFGSHLKFTGTVVLKGVQAPICEGDNAQIDGVIYHIERVMHACSISPDGGKEFTTTLQLSNGISRFSDESVTVYPDLSVTAHDDADVLVIGSNENTTFGESSDKL